MKDSKYFAGDPFFVVKCNDCGEQYWSTRRINETCRQCGSKNVTTEAPLHTIEEKSVDTK